MAGSPSRSWRLRFPSLDGVDVVLASDVHAIDE